MKRKNSMQAPFVLMQGAIWGAYGFLFSYANRYLLAKGLLSYEIGLILGLATAGAFLLQPLLTAGVDKHLFSCRSVLLGAGALMAVCCGLLLVAAKAWLVVLLYALACVALQVLPAFSNAIAMEALHGGKYLNFGIARGIGSVSFGLCAQLAVPAIDRLGLGMIPMLTGFLAIFLMASALRFTQSKSVKRDTKNPTPLLKFFRKNKKFALFLLGSVLLFIGHNVLTNCMYQIARWKGDEAAQGTALLISALVELPAMFLFGFMSKKAASGKWVCLSGVFFTLRLLLSWLLPDVTGLYAAQLAQTLGFALFAVSSVYYVDSVVEKRDVVKGQTYLGISNTLGCLLASFLGGVLIDGVGMEKMFLICTLISLAGMLLLFLSTDKKAT